MIKDQFLLSGKLKSKLSQKEITSLKSRIEKSIDFVEQRRSSVPEIDYPSELPVVEKRDDIKKLVRDNQVLILSGETGSGKTTQIPKICLELGLGLKGLIGHTQPRRIAARAVATRIAEELKTEIGASVGFKVRFSDHVSALSHIKLMTDGILLAEIQNDRYLLQYEVLIIDEAHERSLNIDFILGYLKTILKRRPDLKIIITSATIDTEKFSKHFYDAPVIEVSGRTYPVQVIYHPLDKSEEEPSLQKAISNAVFELNRQQLGDTLVFLPGEREIRETAEYLRKHHPPHTEILPLYSRLTVKEQQKVFSSHKGQRVVLATNVAETSLTVPGIRYVVDAGLARVSRYSIRSRIQRLPIEAISQAAANQRAGRCGRVSAGTCIRLYSEEDYINRPLFTDPEILRINLASAILQMKVLKIGDVFEFPFINMPERKYINDGIKLLEELGAVDGNQNITEIGKALGKFPIDPRLGRMLVEANREGSLTEILIITAFLTIQDPRERPFEAQQKADQFHSRFEDKKSDFLSILKLWAYYQGQSKHLSQNKLRKLCKKEFLSYLRLREWKDILIQLKNAVADLKYKPNSEEAGYEKIHRALLSGLLSNIGFKQEDNEFQGTKQKKFYVFPGSHLKKKPPKWLMASEIVETRKNFARNVAKVEPEWIVDLAKHLVNRHYFDPHWQKNSEQVGAFEKISLYGITIIAKRRVNYGPIEPHESRILFIRHALIYGEMKHQENFLVENLKKIHAIEAMEHKSRRQDILISEDEIFDFYDQKIPENIYSGDSFRKWYKREKKKNSGLLEFDEKALTRKSASHINEETYPDFFTIDGFQFKLSYNFQPGEENDGVTATIPLGVLAQIKPYWFEWLLTSLIQEKVIALIKSLPKALRRNFVPVPDYASALLNDVNLYQQPLLDVLVDRLSKMSGVDLVQTDFDISKVDRHLFFNFELINEQGKVIAKGRDLNAMQREYANLAQQAFQQSPVEALKLENITQWDFGDLPEFKEVRSPHGVFLSYPALVDEKDSVSLQYFPTKKEADALMPKGLLRLIKLNLGQKFAYLQKNIPDIQKICLLSTAIANCNEIKSEIVDLIIREAFLSEQDQFRDQSTFDKLMISGQEVLMSKANDITRYVLQTMQLFHDCKKAIKKMSNPALLEAYADINEHLSTLIYRHYFNDISVIHLQHFPRYLKAVLRRIEKLSSNTSNDRKNMLELKNYWNKYKSLESSNKLQDIEGLMQLRWMIEEFRVSLFAQELKTAYPISAKRLDSYISSQFSNR